MFHLSFNVNATIKNQVVLGIGKFEKFYVWPQNRKKTCMKIGILWRSDSDCINV